MQKENIELWLSEVRLFKELSAHELASIVKIAQTRTYRQHMYVFMEEDPQDRIFFIQSGKIKINKTDFFSGKEQILNVLEPGEMFPHAGFFTEQNYHTHAEVMEEATLLVIPIDKFKDFLITQPELCLKLVSQIGERVIDLQKRLEEQLIHNTYEQIILLLIRLCSSNGIKIGEQYQLTRHFTNRELASMIGTTRETVSRTINHLKKKNYIIPSKESSFLINRIALKQELFE
ncbi:MAG: Crp/Fnr family transcriptional regulator [Bacillus sp. (in: Bacteria)]|nr:Crp/Fnr family transcriptional regulator [Bacillus sp. (in: firmicutes)]